MKNIKIRNAELLPEHTIKRFPILRLRKHFSNKILLRKISMTKKIKKIEQGTVAHPPMMI